MIGKRQLITIVMLVALTCMHVFGVLNLDTVRLSAYESPAIYISPAYVSPEDPESAIGNNYTFSVLTDYNGDDVWGFEFDLTFDPMILEGIEVVNGGLINATVGPTMWNNGTFNNTQGTLEDVGNSFRNDNNVTSGPGTLANITFKVVGCGISNIAFVDRNTKLIGAYQVGEQWFQYNIIDDSVTGHIEGGVFDNTCMHDVAIIDVTANQTVVAPGTDVGINVTAQNQGTVMESFTVTAYANTTIIQTKSVTDLADGTSTNLTFTWSTTGVPYGSYTISANASIVTNETDTADNTYIDGTVTVAIIHDVAIIFVGPNQTVADQGDDVGINVIAQNQGTVMESFTVTAYRDTTIIQTKSVTDLAKGATTILTFTWSTTGVPYGSYTISANASIVTNETDTADNTYIDSTVTIPSPHDVAIIDVTANQTVVTQGDDVGINVTAQNQGTVMESFTVTAYANTTVIQTKSVTDLAKGATTNLTFTWSTTGVPYGSYTISANASIVTDEIDTADNSYIDGTVTVASLEEVDVAVTDVVPWTIYCSGPVSEGYPDWTVNINVTVLNNGTSPATFTVSAYANETLIGTQPVNDLPAGQNTTLTFSWPLTGVPLGPYTLKANATLVGDTNPGDNEFIFGQFLVKLDGDVNGGRVVESTDLVFGLGPAMGSRPGDENWNCQADFNFSGVVESTDLVFGFAPNNGQKY